MYTGVVENFDLEICHGLANNIEDINDMVSQRQKLEKGWLIVSVETGDGPVANWVFRDGQDCIDDVKTLECDLRELMRQRNSEVPSYSISKISTTHLILRNYNYLPALLVKGAVTVKRFLIK